MRQRLLLINSVKYSVLSVYCIEYIQYTVLKYSNSKPD